MSFRDYLDYLPTIDEQPPIDPTDASPLIQRTLAATADTNTTAFTRAELRQMVLELMG